MHKVKPAWWQLYILIPLMVGLVVLEQAMPVPGLAPQLVDVSIVLMVFGGMILWVQSNADRLQDHYMKQEELSSTG